MQSDAQWPIEVDIHQPQADWGRDFRKSPIKAQSVACQPAM
jgi:hypothetical protein